MSDETNIMCRECWKLIKRNEGFIPGEYPCHSPNCNSPFKSDQIKGYKTESERGLKLRYYIDYLE